MIDNLRRSLVAPATLLTLAAGWLIPPAAPGVWTRFVLATIAIPALLPFLMALNPRRRGISKRSYFRALLSDLWIGSSQIALTLTFLAFQAWLMCDAIIRTLFRLLISRRNLLEWVTAAQAKGIFDLKLSSMYRRMGGGVLLVFVTAAILSVGRHNALLAGAPFLALWLAAPLIARDISLPPPEATAQRLVASDETMLRQVARRTWLFFEQFVTKDDNFLPPDNFQEDPKPVVAHRTSPTNVGLYLLSTLSAFDFGWIGIAEAVDRIEATFRTMNRLESFRGHLYNWYETNTLKPLEPRYVSSVDSGNLAGHLLTLVRGCEDLSRSQPGARLTRGLHDNLELFKQALADVSDTRPTHIVTRKQIATCVETISTLLQQFQASSAELDFLTELDLRAQVLSDNVQTFLRERGEALDTELKIWADAIARCVSSHLRDVGAKGPATSTNQPVLLRARSAAVGTVEHSTTPTLTADGAASPSAPSTLEDRIHAIAAKAGDLFHAMDFSFLFDQSRKLFSIGYRGSSGTLDASCYDLLASEARLTSFIAIAKGDVPPSHWFRLGRQFTPVDRGSALISWSGSMFEYLMPSLVMRSPVGSVLAQTNELVVRRQIGYGSERHVPCWGISESAYNARDIDFTYQYSSFGVPGLGLKRGLSEDLVMAPYATALAAMIEPGAATENFKSIARLGGRGTHGFYEALDFTKSRIPEGKNVAVVRAYMAHHQGMSLVSLANVLNDGVMQSRFHSEPIVQASELLLQERTPRDVLVARPRAEEVTSAARIRDLLPPVLRRFNTPHETLPRTQLLSNGRYAVMFTSAGSGYSRWDDIAVTRWREDATRDCWGSYVYLRDVQTNDVWSAGYQPCGVDPDSYEATFYEDRAEIVRRDRSLVTTLELVISSEDDAEMRRVSIANTGTRAREIQVTSFAEICLATQAADTAHPAFSKLFVETEFVPETGALLATRRKQSEADKTLWLAHTAALEQGESGDLEYETDRAKFIGRGNDSRRPVSVMQGIALSGTTGAVLDPIISLRRTVTIPPGKTVRIVFITIMSSSREDALAAADKYRDARVFERILTLAWTQSQVQLHHLAIDTDEANLFQKLANLVQYPDSSLRPSSDVLEQATIDVTQLWPFGISGDLPIVLAVIDQSEDIDVVRQLLRAHEYWRLKQFSADLVIINEEPSSYDQELHGSLAALVRGSQLRFSSEPNDRRGNLYLLRADLVPPQARQTLECIARAILVGRRGALVDQITRASYKSVKPLRRKIQKASPEQQSDELGSSLKLEFFNGLGGFSDEGREYVIALGPGLRTPQPWVNVVANPLFGFIASESGSGYTWAFNSRENQLTPWSNDPVIDPPGEAIYIRDENSGDLWSATSSPIREEGILYVARHGQGYSRFEHLSHGIRHHMVQFVPAKDPIKISRLTLANESARTRRLSITAYAEWVLGNLRSSSALYIVTERDSQTGALFSRSILKGEFHGRVAFTDLAGRQESWTADRREFLGRHGSLECPVSLERGVLSGKTGAALDPCAALQSTIELRPGAQTEIVFLMGQGADANEARQLIAKYRETDLNDVLVEVTRQWGNVLNAVQVSTPDRAANILVNRWLLYQTLSCRVWGRTAFYQVSGAYGFRDQLQDVMALAIAKRDVAREHLLRAAGRQFVEGDVQHWWHPPLGRGVRTRISDDKVWLPYAVNHFVKRTGDRTVLDETVPFLEGERLQDGQTDAYFQPGVSKESATLFEHCARSLDASLALGPHGLPLMGTGDWNDGMNRVGYQGKGESVWLAWFLHTVLSNFVPIATERGEHERAQNWHLHAGALKAALEREGWDGEWYRRAFYDDGTPLGSSANDECRIDSIAQSWSVISRAAEQNRSLKAMDEVYRQLVGTNDQLVLLFTPPFDHGTKNPGYIKGYIPGVRENGGQYTHASVWNVLAFAMLGDGRRAWELFGILNPVNHASSRAGVQRYKVEPYVMAGDVYANEAHVGRGGWTWYTGSSGWMYRVALESVLGFQMHGMSLRIDPCIPPEWKGFSITFRYHSATYQIEIGNPSNVSRGVALTRIDGVVHAGAVDIPLADDSRLHEILVVLG